MAQIILAAFLLWLFISFPQILLTTVVILVVLYVLSNNTIDLSGIFKPIEEKEEKEENSGYTVTEEDRKRYGEFINDAGAVDWEGYHRAQVEKEMKPGYQDDPEWQEQSRKIKEDMRKARMESEREEMEDLIGELNETERNFWRKVK